MKRAVKAGCGGAGAATIGCSAEQEGPSLIYLNQLILHAVLDQKMRGEQVFFYEEHTFFYCVHAVSLLFNLEAARQGRSVLFSDEQKLLFEGGKKGFAKNTKLDFMRS